MKRFVTILIPIILAVVFFVFPSEADAQQTFQCAYIGTGSQTCIVDVDLSDPACDYTAGGANQDFCAQFNEDEEACNNAAGFCQSCTSPSFCAEGGCPSGSSESSGTCASTTATCCLEDDITPPPPEVCFECRNNFGTNTCFAVAAGEDGCGTNWSDPVQCAEECENADTFNSFYCNEAENQCLVAAPGEGEFEGDNAYLDCLSACIDIGGTYGDQYLFCDSNGEPTNRYYNGTLYTAIGCVPVEEIGAVSSFFLGIGLGIGGGLSLLLMGFAGILINTSSGNPRRLQVGRELLTAAIAGLMLVIFSAFILRVLGVEILGISNLAS